MDWETSDNPTVMLNGKTISDRKYRAFCCACYRMFRDSGRVQTVERVYDEVEEWDFSRDRWTGSPREAAEFLCKWADARTRATVAALLREIMGNPFCSVEILPGWLTQDVRILANIAYGDRPGRMCNTCNGIGGIANIQCPDCKRTGRVVDGRLDSLTLTALADCLVEAGCPEEVNEYTKTNDGWADAMCPNRILTHLRSPGPHFRGCWVLDLLLGK